MSTVDWIIVTILLVSSLVSLMRGFVKEALSLVAWLAAAAISFAYHPKLAFILTDDISSPLLRTVAAAAILFVATLVAFSLLNIVIAQLVKATGLSGTDRVLGMVFGFFRGVIIVMAMIMLLPTVLHLDETSWWQESKLIPHLQMLEGGIKKLGNEVLGMAAQIQS